MTGTGAAVGGVLGGLVAGGFEPFLVGFEPLGGGSEALGGGFEPVWGRFEPLAGGFDSGGQSCCSERALDPMLDTSLRASSTPLRTAIL